MVDQSIPQSRQRQIGRIGFQRIVETTGLDEHQTESLLCFRNILGKETRLCFGLPNIWLTFNLENNGRLQSANVDKTINKKGEQVLDSKEFIRFVTLLTKRGDLQKIFTR